MTGHIIMKRVRVSFPHLWDFPQFSDGPGKAGCVLLFPAGHPDEAKIRAGIDAMTKTDFGGVRLPSQKICLTEPGESGRPEYEDWLSMSATAKANKLPVVMAADGRSRVQTAAQCQIYAGCYVNAKVQLWAQKSAQWGKRINCELIAIQFAGDGEPLSSGHVSEEEAMAGFADELEGFEL